MFPYLGATAMMATADLPDWSIPALLAGYCTVMVVPALVLFALRTLGAARIDRLLQRLNDWVIAKGGGMLSWIMGIAGFLVARDAVVRLCFPSSSVDRDLQDPSPAHVSRDGVPQPESRPTQAGVTAWGR